MKEQFVTYEIALKLKELSFDEECLAGYIKFRGSGTFELAFYKNKTINFNKTSNIYVSAPLWQQSFDWFRKNHNLDFLLDSIGGNNGYFFAIQDVLSGDKILDWSDTYYSYQEARLECLKKLIELCKNN